MDGPQGVAGTHSVNGTGSQTGLGWTTSSYTICRLLTGHTQREEKIQRGTEGGRIFHVFHINVKFHAWYDFFFFNKITYCKQVIFLCGITDTRNCKYVLRAFVHIYNKRQSFIYITLKIIVFLLHWIYQYFVNTN